MVKGFVNDCSVGTALIIIGYLLGLFTVHIVNIIYNILLIYK